MNAETPDRRQKLLEDVIQDESFAKFNKQLRAEALGEFRHARFMRLMRRVGAMAAMLAVLVVLGHSLRPLTVSQDARSQTKARSDLISAAQTDNGSIRQRAGISLLTDKELVASFPPNTCYLAEVDGRKMLVFRDPELRKQYLH